MTNLPPNGYHTHCTCHALTCKFFIF